MKKKEQIKELTRQLRLVVQSPDSIEAKVIIEATKKDIEFEKSLLVPVDHSGLIIKLGEISTKSYEDFVKRYHPEREKVDHSNEHYETTRELGRKHPPCD